MKESETFALSTNPTLVDELNITREDNTIVIRAKSVRMYEYWKEINENKPVTEGHYGLKLFGQHIFSSSHAIGGTVGESMSGGRYPINLDSQGIMWFFRATTIGEGITIRIAFPIPASELRTWKEAVKKNIILFWKEYMKPVSFTITITEGS